MSVVQAIYSEEELKEVKDSLIEEDEVYLYKVQKYVNEDYGYLYSMFIEINYEINEEEYISIFAINTAEPKK